MALISPPVSPGPFCLATVIACSKVISAATTVPASPDPFSKSNTCLISDEAGGVPISMVNPFLSSILILTGTCIPAISLVFEFISSTTSLTLTPVGPNDGPSGGPADAFPASTSASIVSPINLPLSLELLRDRL